MKFNGSSKLDNLVIFDGVCNLCAKSVRFVLRHEKKPILHFTPMQSATGARLMREHGVNPEDADTFIVIADGRAFVKSDAAIQLSKFLCNGWRLLGVIKFVPRPIRDWFYNVIARNRYQWFGRSDECMVPTPEVRARFIEN